MPEHPVRLHQTETASDEFPLPAETRSEPAEPLLQDRYRADLQPPTDDLPDRHHPAAASVAATALRHTQEAHLHRAAEATPHLHHHAQATVQAHLAADTAEAAQAAAAADTAEAARAVAADTAEAVQEHVDNNHKS